MTDQIITVATNITADARAKLVAFCHHNLRDGFEANQYAAGLIEEIDLDNGAHFEIRGEHTKSGSPATISFTDDSDLVLTSYNELGEPV